MKLKCPRCSYEYDFREAAKNQDLIAIIKMQADFAPHSRLVFEYAELFETTRPIKAAKLLRILSEALNIWKAGQFSFQKSVYTISKEGFAQALRTVCNKNFSVPLENHNYLKKVLVSMAETETQRRSATAEKELERKEAGLRAGINRREENIDETPAPIGEAIEKLPWRKGL